VTAPKAQLIIATSIRLAKQIKSSDNKVEKGSALVRSYRLPPPSRRGRKESTDRTILSPVASPRLLPAPAAAKPRASHGGQRARGRQPRVDRRVRRPLQLRRPTLRAPDRRRRERYRYYSPTPSPSAKFGVNFAYANSMSSGCHGAAMSESHLINSWYYSDCICAK
jgi:hypothetical protein